MHTLTFMTNPLTGIKKIPAVGALAERQMGGFLALSALVGVAVGAGAAALVLALEWVSHLMEGLFVVEDEAGIWSLERAWIFLTVPTGLLAAWWLAKRFAPEVSGDGVPAATEALMVRGGRIRGRVAPLKVLATAFTVGMGGSAGREGPIVQVLMVGVVVNNGIRSPGRNCRQGFLGRGPDLKRDPAAAQIFGAGA